MAQSQSKTTYTLTVDEDLLRDIEQALRLQAEQELVECHSDEWHRLQDILNDVLHDIGWSVVYEFKDLPF